MKTSKAASAASQGLISCHVCGLLSQAPAVAHGAHATHRAQDVQCPRCHSRLEHRKPHSIQRTWALIIAAFILYIPANTLPILETRSLVDSQASTIMNGVRLFWESGSWFIAGLIFFASIVVPLTKLIALALLLVSIHLRLRWSARQRTRLYRFVEVIGRWSMLDIYVVALSVALVQARTVASMQAGTGAVAFGAVAVLTMFAAHTFDPRLIWDAEETRRE
jgi:paraquat-inducible protein A